MHNFKINHKRVIAILLTSFVLLTSGCSTTTNEVMIDDTKQIDLATENTLLENNKKVNEEHKDEQIINYMDNTINEVEDYINNSNSDTLSDKIKNNFIKVVDFIFFDTEINGVTFDELTDETKEYVLNTVSKLDKAIMKKYPDYKENISSTTGKAYNYLAQKAKEGSTNIKDFIKDKIGIEQYNKIADNYENIKGAAGDLLDEAGNLVDNGVSKIKKWYENFKDN